MKAIVKFKFYIKYITQISFSFILPCWITLILGDHQIVANRNSNTSSMTGYNSVSSRRNNSDNSLHTIASGDNGVIGGGMDPGGGSAAAAVKKRSITSMVESFLDEHKVRELIWAIP